ncbi:response regulator [Desulfococcaceae bacterium HSG8]|nr:response regulator [Desulfococcaceae bacterium HSG8]
MEREYNILIIDDEKEILATYKDHFVKREFHVDTAHDGAEGLEKLKNGEFDVAIVDILMPKMNGIEMIRQAHEAGIDTSMIVLTGHGGGEEAIAAINIGVDAWFEKSGINMTDLFSKVKELAEGVSLDEIRRILSVIPEKD